MSYTVTVWLVAAVFVFWALGAYNRLVRLRSQGLVTFAVLANIFNQYILLTKSCVRPTDDLGATSDWANVDAVVTSFASSLSLAQAQPLNEVRMKALKASYDALLICWAQISRKPPDMHSSSLPADTQAHWAHISVQADIAQAEFKRAVDNYNHAISQFPAVLLVWIFGFKPAQSL
jgi:LemA protein